MKATINEEGIMDIKALVMSRNIFKQLQEVRQKELGDPPGSPPNWVR